jgi:transcriptional regulator with XRE-family HTH domain
MSANRLNQLHEATRLAAWQLAEVGREVRLARIRAGMRQADVARRVGTSAARISLLERGLLPSVSYRDIARVASVVGMKAYLRVFIGGRHLLDAPQLELFARLAQRTSSAWALRTEVPIPREGDLRAVDCVGAIPGCVLVIELITRLSDYQAQARSALHKQRDLPADRCILVLAATRANRRALREADAAMRASFPLGTREVMAALAEGRDPGANGVVLL